MLNREASLAGWQKGNKHTQYVVIIVVVQTHTAIIIIIDLPAVELHASAMHVPATMHGIGYHRAEHKQKLKLKKTIANKTMRTGE